MRPDAQAVGGSADAGGFVSIYLLRAAVLCAGAPATAIIVLVFVGRGFNPLR